VGTADPMGVDVVTVGPTAPALVRAAVALRWNRPDLTATLAELVLESATDVESWVVAAGWLLHGRAALGDGRDTASDLLDGLERWGQAGVELMAGPMGRRLRVELAGPARRIGEPAVARALLSAESAADDDPELRADVLTELARCAVDDAPDTADDALAAAEQAWQAAACAPGVASVMLLSAARNRRAGRADVATAQAADGLGKVNAGGHRPGATTSDHVAAALTAEWIAALVEAGRVDEARGDALPAANRLIATARPSRQVAGLRLAIARLSAVADGPDVVLAALEPAAQDAADSNVPELESACRSMLGELHESAGRLDAALAAVRAAMAAERRDRDRGAGLRGRLTAAAASWAGRPSSGATPALPFDTGSPDHVGGSGTGSPGIGGGADEAAGPWSAGGFGAAGPTGAQPAGRERVLAEPALERRDGVGRRARRRAAELLGDAAGGAGGLERSSGLDPTRDAVPGEYGRADGGRGDSGRRARRGDDVLDGNGRTLDGLSVTSRWESSARRGAGSPGGWSAAGGGSLIGDALLRELGGGRSAAEDRDGTRGDDGRIGDPGAAVPAADPLFGPLGVEMAERHERHRSGGAGRRDGSELPASGPGAHREVASTGSAVDFSTVQWDRVAWADRPSSVADTVVLGLAADESVGADARDDTGTRAVGPPDAARHVRRPGFASHIGIGAGDASDRSRHVDPTDTRRYGRSRDGTARHGGSPGGAGSTDAPRADGSTGSRTDQPGRPGDGAARFDGPVDGSRTEVRAAVGREYPAAAPDDRSRGSGRLGRATRNGHGVAERPWTDGRPAGGSVAGTTADPGTSTKGAPSNGTPSNGVPSNGVPSNGVPSNGMYANGQAHGIHADRDGADGTAFADRDGARGGAPGSPTHGAPAGPGAANGPTRRGAGGRGPGRPPSTDADGLGLADLLAGALAAYRDL
jgi:hypothetical protein